MRRQLRLSLHHRAPRLAGAALCLLAVAGPAAAPAGAAAAARPAARRAARPAHAARHKPPRARAASDPAVNRTLSPATLWACQVEPAGTTCVSSVLGAIDRARAAEGVRPMRLPAGFAALSQPRQLFVIANLERTDRGLVPAVGLSRGLDQNALSAARANQDPIPTPF
jgi:hypothetical protein